MLLLTKNSTNNLGLKKLNVLPPIRQPDIEKKIYLRSMKQHQTAMELSLTNETCKGLLFLLPRMPQVLGRSPAPSSGLRSPNRPIVMKESVLWKYMKQSFQQLSFLCGHSLKWRKQLFSALPNKKKFCLLGISFLNLQVLLDVSI